MSTYRPSYGVPISYPPPPPPPSYSIPPLPPGPPPSYDPYRSVDSYRPPQSDFSFRNDDRGPQLPREQDSYRPSRSKEYVMQERERFHPRNRHKDNMNLNTARRGNNQRDRQNFRVAPADRPLLRHHDKGNGSEQVLGMANGQRFMAAEDVSDSDEENMDESDSEPEASKANLVTPSIGDGSHDIYEDSLEPPSKRRALTTTFDNAQDRGSEPKWSNPDPYTVLPPVDEVSRKRKDVVKLIRKARKETDEIAERHSQVAANDDFISFSLENDEEVMPTNPAIDGPHVNGHGIPGAPQAPRSFSHLQSLHGQGTPKAPELSIRTASATGPAPSSSNIHDSSKISEEIILDYGPVNHHTTFIDSGDENLGNRKRTHDDYIKGRKKGLTHNNGSILADWRPLPGMDPVPWLNRTDIITPNAGFRLHKEVCDFYDYVQPKDFEHTVRQELLSRLQETISHHLPNASVMCFGSFAAGLYLPNADMDVVVVSNSFRLTGQKVACQTNSQMRRFAKFLEDSGLTKTACDVVTGAKVPIIKFVDRITGIRVDVSFENNTGILANDTFADWKKQFPAMPILVTIIKQFLMMRGLNEVQFGGLGGFSVTCLVTSLLQNMPRVQSGDIVPEQHLGEMLLEFLDFYGNRLDLTRTGIMMQPPGYFDKQYYARPGKQKATYQAFKTSRLAIIDPNKADNDISGGSREVTLIFDRFGQAHAEILQAMKSPGRVSLLDWSLGGNYESFASLRNHLLKLYREKWGSPADNYAQNRISEMHNVGNGQLNGIRGRGNLRINDSAASTSHAFSGPPLQVGSKPNPNNKRARDLKVQFPNLQAIPSSVSKNERPQLIASQTGQQIKESKKPSTKSSRGKARALALKAEYPDMGKVPKSIGKKQRQNMIKAYKEQNRAVQKVAADVKLKQPSMLASRPPGSRSNTEKQVMPTKMAPLSAERRAEVSRNLSGHSNDDPITLD